MGSEDWESFPGIPRRALLTTNPTASRQSAGTKQSPSIIKGHVLGTQRRLACLLMKGCHCRRCTPHWAQSPLPLDYWGTMSANFHQEARNTIVAKHPVLSGLKIIEYVSDGIVQPLQSVFEIRCWIRTSKQTSMETWKRRSSDQGSRSDTVPGFSLSQNTPRAAVCAQAVLVSLTARKVVSVWSGRFK